MPPSMSPNGRKREMSETTTFPPHGGVVTPPTGPFDLGAHGLAPRPSDPRALLGYFDHVTLLPNRISFMRDMTQRMRHARDGRVLLLLTLADAGHFSDILRALGHAFADDFVREGAAQFTACAPPGAVVYHVSVLSFAVMLEPEEPGAAGRHAQTMVQRFRAPIFCGSVPILTRAGVGVFAFQHDITPAANLRAALAAAQQSRLLAPGWTEYSRDLDDAHRRAFVIIADLAQAVLAHDQLSMVYQPRVDLATGRPQGAEALIRWTHPKWGPISPGEFIPLAEATALMGELTDWVLRRVLHDMSGWPYQWHTLRISVNTSPNSLHDPGFVGRLEALLAEFEILPQRIELEVTEGSLTSVNETVLTQIARIRALRINLAIDDFGTGYSNFESLIRLDAQVLKVDQSFIRSMDTEPRRRLLARSIIGLAQSLGFSVVAEGIETRESLDRLAAWGCNEGQGYFISRPLAHDAFTAWMGDRGGVIPSSSHAASL